MKEKVVLLLLSALFLVGCSTYDRDMEPGTTISTTKDLSTPKNIATQKESHSPGYISIDTAATHIYKNIYCSESLVDVDKTITDSLFDKLSNVTSSVIGKVSTND